MARGGAARRLAGVGGLGATEGLLACGLVQKKEHDMSKPLECTGWLIEAQLWLAVMRGGPGSPTCRDNAVPAPIRSGFGV